MVHVVTTDSPDTLEYDVDEVIPGTLYDVRMRLGFRVDPKVTVYLRQIVEDLVARGHLSLTSGYPSLASRGIPGDFHFIVIHRVFSPSSNCPPATTRLMNLHRVLSHLGVSDERAYGLDTSVVTSETVPLIINTSPGRRITPAAD